MVICHPTRAEERIVPQVRRRRRAETSRAEIVAAAEHRIAEFGYDATRLEDVATDVGLGRSGVLYHFPDKRQLYRAVLDDLFGDEVDRLRRALAGSGSLPDRIERVIDVAIDFLVERPAAARIALREASATDPAIRDEVRRQSGPLFDLLRLIFEEGERSGELNPVDTDPYFFLSAVAGTLIFYLAALPTFFERLPFDPVAPEQIARLKRNVLRTVQRLLGMGGVRPVSDLEFKMRKS
jgi:AcrR family transcriptional regulator